LRFIRSSDIRALRCAGWNRTRPQALEQLQAAGRGIEKDCVMGLIWTVIIGFVAGLISRFIMPGNNEPSGFILTTLPGIVGAFVASCLGQTPGLYGPNEGAGLIGAANGAIIVLAVWAFVSRRGT
jgi:uncharacterized membrane protein YeaQ/YmgE (transglycosylase-associated protein family)